MSDSLLHAQSDYRSFLEQTLRSRKARNNSYSLRCFARDIGLSASRVSEIFQGKDGLSVRKATQVATSLGLSSFESEHFLAMVEAQSGRSPVTRRMATAKLVAMKESLNESRKTVVMREDCIAMLTGWQHFALIELSRAPGFRSNAKWIGKRLSVPVTEVEACIDRLLRAGLLKKKRNKFVATEQRFSTTNDVPSSALRDFHASILQLAVQAIDQQKIEDREFAASFFPLDLEDLPELKEELRAARRKIVRKYEEKLKNKDSTKVGTSKPTKVEVYCFTNQLFRVSTPEDQYDTGKLH